VRTSPLLLLPALLACSGCGGGSGAPDAARAGGLTDGPPSADRPVPPAQDAGNDASVWDASATDSGAPPALASGCNQNGWCWAHPLPQENTLLAVWGAAAADVWAVGDRGAIVHWDGQRWSPVASPTREFLRCVWGTGPSDVWAAGDYAVIHWDGQVWKMVKNATITSIQGSGPNNVWFAWASSYLHWNGHDLKEGSFRNEGTNGYYNLAFWVESPTRVWSVGYPATIEAGNVSGRELQFDIVHSIEGPARLTAVWGTGTELWIVDEQGGIHHRASGMLTAIPSGVDNDVSLNAVWGSAPGDIWVAGDKGTLLRGGATGFVPQPVPTDQALYGLWGFGQSDVWAVGSAGVIVHWDGQR
jgi:hypothetical protein